MKNVLLLFQSSRKEASPTVPISTERYRRRYVWFLLFPTFGFIRFNAGYSDYWLKGTPLQSGYVAHTQRRTLQKPIFSCCNAFLRLIHKLQDLNELPTDRRQIKMPQGFIALTMLVTRKCRSYLCVSHDQIGEGSLYCEAKFFLM